METTTNNLSPQPCPPWCEEHLEQEASNDPVTHERHFRNGHDASVVLTMTDGQPARLLLPQNEDGYTAAEVRKLLPAVLAAAEALGVEGLSGE